MSRPEALTKLIEVTTFTPDEAAAALDFVVSQFTEDTKNVNWSFALDVALWVYEPRRKVRLETNCTFGNLTISPVVFQLSD